MGVVGAGQMGAGIAEVSLRAGADVRIYEPTEALADAGRDRITEVAGARCQQGQADARPIATRRSRG